VPRVRVRLDPPVLGWQGAGSPDVRRDHRHTRRATFSWDPYKAVHSKGRDVRAVDDMHAAAPM